MGRRKTLGICIPTYNRGNRLKELIEELLLCREDDFVIIITDNCSTDNTSEVLKSFCTSRVIVCGNSEKIPGYKNIIQSVFNCPCKYCLLCNDRDLIDHSILEETILFLRNNEISFGRILDYEPKTPDSYKIYNKGVDSLEAIKFSFHPTGTIYNLEVMSDHNMQPDNYARWDGTERYCKLGWDLAWLGKTAIIRNNLWKFAEMEYYAANESGYSANRINRENIYFHPKERIKNAEIVSKYLLSDCPFSNFSDLDEKGALALMILEDFFNNIKYYKCSSFSYYENAHYGLKKRFVFTHEMFRWLRVFEQSAINMLYDNGVPANYIEIWKKKKAERKLRVMRSSLTFDAVFFKRFLLGQKW